MNTQRSIDGKRRHSHLGSGAAVAATILLTLTLAGCEREFSPTIPEFDRSTSMLNGARTLKSGEQRLVEGVYRVERGAAHFGEEVALRFVNDQASIFCRPDGTYFLLDAGVRQSEVFLEGYWRKSLNLKTGAVQISIAEAEGGRDVITGSGNAGIAISGRFSTEAGGNLDQELRLEWARPLPDSNEQFYIIGHRGGGRNSDFLPHSENSLPMIRFAPRLGCNAIEIDVLLTADNVPILYHDLEFSTRLVESDHMVGPVSNYTFTQIRRFARLINGELIPTFEEALKTIEMVPEISFVWVDVKTPETMGVIAPMIREWNRKRTGDSSRAELVAGLPLAPIYDAYRELPAEDRPQALCELGPEPTREIDARAWAPRWTLGLQRDELAAMQGEGRYGFVWTLDIPDLVSDYIAAGYDGILSNYPSIVAYYYYTGGVE